MKILIAFDADLFGKGAVDLAAENLVLHLNAQEHEVEILRVPLPREGSSEAIKQMMLFKFIELSNVDRVIALTFPACLINHPNKSVWLLRQFQSPEVFDESTAEAIRSAYRSLVKDGSRVYTNSIDSSEELQRYAGIESISLSPPAVEIVDPISAREPESHSREWSRLIETLLA